MTIAAKCMPDEEFLAAIEKAGYTGLVVSEARTSLQTYKEFKRLNDFFCKWESIHRK